MEVSGSDGEKASIQQIPHARIGVSLCVITKDDIILDLWIEGKNIWHI